MTDQQNTTPAKAEASAVPSKKGIRTDRRHAVLPVLELLFKLYPALFGSEFLPLKLGVFQEILAAHPEKFKKDSLRAALGIHTRSTRYLAAVASGKWRHDLGGDACEPVAPEHVFLAIVEIYKRRQIRQTADLRPQAIAQIADLIQASGLSCADFEVRIPSTDEISVALLQEAVASFQQSLAKQSATARAFGASGKTIEEFADMYGLAASDVAKALKIAGAIT